MHRFEMPQEYVKRVVARQGRAHACERFDAPKTALVVVDMQNYFMVEPYQSACAQALEIVPNINRLADAMRKAGGKVIWVQNLAPWESERSWSVCRAMYLPEKAKARWEAMQRDNHGFELYPKLDVREGDEHVVKRRYSAFIQGSSNIENVLRDNRIDTLVITGVATNVCCESTARDAMMLNYRALLVSDGCATASDGEHAATMGNFYLYFGDVQTTDEVIARLK
ncbi:MAG: cysteine hydrolase [Betaproteobacteria bacterium]|nr:cysteine hydrolase [Betaproteobacteria bacterium]MBI2959550.1 cysteine hydrolase [Betaproteobacteria bacterium]